MHIPENMQEDDFEFKGDRNSSENQEEDLAYEEERERSVSNDETDPEEAGFTAGYYEEDEASKIETE